MREIKDIYLSFASLFSVDNVLEAISQYGHLNHLQKKLLIINTLFYFIPLVSCIALFEPDPWSCTSCTVCLIIPAGFVLCPHCPKNQLNLRIKPWACQISSGFSCKIYVWFGLHIRLRNQTYIDASAMAGSFLSGDSD